MAEAIVTELSAMKSTRSFEPRAWVIMPDHLHLFFHLNEKLSLGQVVGRLKTKTRAALAAQNLAWQGNYYEHRLRPDDPVEDVLRYIFLNPYRAGLLEPSAKYSHFSLCDEDAAWFTATLDDQRPIPDWLVTS